MLNDSRFNFEMKFENSFNLTNKSKPKITRNKTTEHINEVFSLRKCMFLINLISIFKLKPKRISDIL